jgi:uncharacterized protein (TIGR02996 family)
MATKQVSFLRAIAEHANDDSYRLVFADWLEEHGDWRAEFLRLDCSLHAMTGEEPTFADLKARWQELRSRLSPGWLMVLGRSAVENCEPRFKFVCTQRWEQLLPTKVAAVRFCEECHKKVHYCHNIEEARDHADQGHCVAVDAGVARKPDDLISEFDLVLGGCEEDDDWDVEDDGEE